MQLRCVALSLLFASTLSAQAPDTTRLPRELAAALLSSGGDAPAMVVGRAPAAEAEPLVPPGLRIVGGTRNRPRQPGYSGSYTVAAVERSRAETFALGREHLRRSGWREAPRDDLIEEGFVASMSRDVVNTDFCKDSSYVQLGTRTRPEGGSFLLVRHALASEGGPCRNPPPRMRGMEPISPLPMPSLLPPDDASGISFGTGSADGSAESSARIHARMSSADLVQHYSDQLKKEGWTLTRRVTEGDLVSQWAKRSYRGAALVAVLVNYRLPEDDHRISLTIYGKLPAGAR